MPTRRSRSALRTTTACVFLVTGLALSGASARAQTGDASPADIQLATDAALPEISVIATRTPRSINEIGSALTIITREDLEERQTSLVSDVLRDVPGVAVNRTGPLGTLTQVRIRGAEGNHTLVLINGIEANDPAGGREFDFADLLADDVERIEILRGPQSALYGSEAIGGVISITTRQGRGPIRGSARVEGGSFGTVQGGASLSGGGDSYGFASSVSFLRTAGIDISGSNGEEDGYANQTLDFTGHIEPFDQLRIDLAGRYVNAGLDTDGQEFTFGRVVDALDNTSDTQQAYGLARATLTLFDGLWEQSAGFAITDTYNAFDGSFGPSFSEATLTDINYQTDVYLETPEFGNAEHVATFFFEREETDFDNTFAPPNETVDFACVGQYQLSLFDQLFLSGSVRHDSFDGLENFTTYRLTAAYQLPEFGTRFHGSFGTGVQRPSPTEQFGFFPDRFLGNPDLVPEESTGWDIGVEQALFNDRLIVDVTYFNANLENEIISVFDPVAGLPSVANGDGESERQGVEISLTASPFDGFDLTASYTYTDATDPDGQEEVRRAPHIASLNANYRFLDDRANLNLGISYNGEQEDLEFGSETPETRVRLDDFTLINLSGSYRLSGNVEIFGRVENLIDEDYQEVFGFNTPGIGGFAGIRITM